ncbi:hypothetical protein ACMFMG_001519 [Clarireedia jacksonii]
MCLLQDIPIFITPTAAITDNFTSTPTIAKLFKWEMQIPILIIFTLLLIMCFTGASLIAFLANGTRGKRGNKNETQWDEERDGYTQDELYHSLCQLSNSPGPEISAIMTENEEGGAKGEEDK